MEKTYLYVIGLAFLLFSAVASAGNKSYLNYQGRIIKPDGSLVNAASVSMSVQILGPDGCGVYAFSSAFTH